MQENSIRPMLRQKAGIMMCTDSPAVWEPGWQLLPLNLRSGQSHTSFTLWLKLPSTCIESALHYSYLLPLLLQKSCYSQGYLWHPRQSKQGRSHASSFEAAPEGPVMEQSNPATDLYSSTKTFWSRIRQGALCGAPLSVPILIPTWSNPWFSALLLDNSDSLVRFYLSVPIRPPAVARSTALPAPVLVLLVRIRRLNPWLVLYVHE